MVLGRMEMEGMEKDCSAGGYDWPRVMVWCGLVAGCIIFWSALFGCLYALWN